MATVSQSPQEMGTPPAGHKPGRGHPIFWSWVWAIGVMLAIFAFFALVVGLASLLPNQGGGDFQPLMFP